MTPREVANRRIGYWEREKVKDRGQWELSRWELFNQGRFAGVKINNHELESVYDIIIFEWEEDIREDKKLQRIKQEERAAEIFPDRI